MTKILIGKPRARRLCNDRHRREWLVYGLGCFVRMKTLEEAVREWRSLVEHKFDKSNTWCFGLKSYTLVFGAS